MTDGSRNDRPWWQRGIVYQVYPRSFQDANGDGVGDLRGVTARLDYLQWLGVDAIWLSPIFPSPMADFGYDVSDYCDIHPLFGTLADFDELMREAHARDLKIILDYVPNHTSDRHPWFLASRASRASPKRDWYLWRDPAPDGGPPNNWIANFGGRAWELDERTGQSYYHAFLIEQPDLNWRNPEVRRAMYDVLRFWMERGVDGFRVDVLWQIVKDEEFRDNPPNPNPPVHGRPFEVQLRTYNADLPEVQEVVREMRRVLDEYPERVMIGELYLPLDRLVAYYGENLLGCQLPYNFFLVTSDWSARLLSAYIDEYEAAIPPGGWPNWVLGNHDRPRIASRVGAAQARVAAVLLLTLRGTPTLYYGDEIGMRDVAIPPEKRQDPAGNRVASLNRDPERTPMQWDASPNAGFSPGPVEPWLPLAEDFREVNVAAQRDDPASLLSLYRRLIDLRRREPALSVGSYAPVESNGDVLAYVRAAGERDRRYLVALNLGANADRLDLTTVGIGGRVVIGTDPDREGEPVRGAVDLRGDEALVVEVEPAIPPPPTMTSK
jgi:alpha-glucosidase